MITTSDVVLITVFCVLLVSGMRYYLQNKKRSRIRNLSPVFYDYDEYGRLRELTVIEVFFRMKDQIESCQEQHQLESRFILLEKFRNKFGRNELWNELYADMVGRSAQIMGYE